MFAWIDPAAYLVSVDGSILPYNVVLTVFRCPAGEGYLSKGIGRRYGRRYKISVSVNVCYLNIRDDRSTVPLTNHGRCRSRLLTIMPLAVIISGIHLIIILMGSIAGNIQECIGRGHSDPLVILRSMLCTEDSVAAYILQRIPAHINSIIIMVIRSRSHISYGSDSGLSGGSF